MVNFEEIKVFLLTYVNKINEIGGNNQGIYESIMKELPICLLLSNYYWCIWAIFMSKNPDINFDYVEFAYSRYSKYRELK